MNRMKNKPWLFVTYSRRQSCYPLQSIFCITSSSCVEASLPEPSLLNFVLTQQTHKRLIDEINMLALRMFQNNSLANKFA